MCTDAGALWEPPGASFGSSLGLCGARHAIAPAVLSVERGEAYECGAVGSTRGEMVRCTLPHATAPAVLSVERGDAYECGTLSEGARCVVVG